MAYRLELETRAVKELRGLAREPRELLSNVLDDLQREPRPPGAKKLSGEEDYRVRKGDYRILYAINDTQRLVRVYRLGHRREVYRRR
ncbi:MAG: type II toxin-antitoxin system RelE/ParE family toxin [Elusimicrobia bacterium]|nr:type II toxin-antitoxin system RelE/ParE family toxin [Elusimicrobiota bacterium]